MRKVDLEMVVRAVSSTALGVTIRVRMQASTVRYDLEFVCSLAAGVIEAADRLVRREGLDGQEH